jgi:hypothetical protein
MCAYSGPTVKEEREYCFFDCQQRRSVTTSIVTTFFALMTSVVFARKKSSYTTDSLTAAEELKLRIRTSLLVMSQDPRHQPPL